MRPNTFYSHQFAVCYNLSRSLKQTDSIPGPNPPSMVLGWHDKLAVKSRKQFGKCFIADSVTVSSDISTFDIEYSGQVKSGQGQGHVVIIKLVLAIDAAINSLRLVPVAPTPWGTAGHVPRPFFICGGLRGMRVITSTNCKVKQRMTY